MQINLFHVLVVGPVLLGIDYLSDKTIAGLTQRDLCLALGMLTLTLPFMVGLPIPGLAWHNAISYTHMVVWIPLFAYISWRGVWGPGLDKNWLTMLRFLGLTVIVVHLYLLVGRLLNLKSVPS